MRLTIDRAPLIAYMAVLLASWGAADYFFKTTIMVRMSPELPVWAAYDNKRIGYLLAWAIAGLLCAASLPLGRDPEGQNLAGEVQASAKKLSWLWTLLAIGTLVAAIYVKGPFLFRAPVYLSFAASPVLVSIAGSAQPIGVLAAGVVSVRRPWLGALAASLWFVVLFAYATRTFAAVLVLVLVGRWLGGGRTHWLGWVAGGLSALILLPVPLLSREMPEHGLYPYWWGIRQLLKNPTFFDTASHLIASNLGFGIPLLAKTSQETGITWQDMIISINPAPTRMAGWDKIMESMRIHDFIPYSAMGEWARFGGLALMGFTFTWGIIVRGSLRSIASSRSMLKVPFLAAVLGIGLISMVLTLQYNTRAVARMLDMIVLVAIIERLSRAPLGWLGRKMGIADLASGSSEVTVDSRQGD